MHAFTRLTIPSKCRHCKKSCYFHAVYCSKCHIACHRKCTEELEVRYLAIPVIVCHFPSSFVTPHDCSPFLVITGTAE